MRNSVPSAPMIFPQNAPCPDRWIAEPEQTASKFMALPPSAEIQTLRPAARLR